MAAQRIRFVPWLIEQINSGAYPGVNWTNEEQTEFCVPWKHGLRQDSSSHDVAIFKAWAEVNTESETSPDPSVWKRNFRSALRAKGFKSIEDNKNDSANPHRVFRLPDGEGQQGAERSRRRSRREAMEDNAASVGSQELNKYRSPIPAQCAPVEFLQQNPFPETPVPFVPKMYHVDGAVGTHTEMRDLTELKENKDKTVVDKDLSTNFRVSVYYRGVKVLETLVEGRRGFRVASRAEEFHPLTLPTENDPCLGLVSLPSLDQVIIPDQLQAQLTKCILDKLGGLEVWVEGSVVYGQRRGSTHIYWSLCKHEKSDTPRVLGKDRSELYTLSNFVTGLVEFIRKGKGEAPSFSLFFCLGEKWPDQRPWEKKLIMIEVVLTALETLKMMAVEGGASSLGQVELQLSNTSSLVDTLMDWMDSC